MLLRANVAVFTSSVRGIPGSNNRLDQQPRGSLNFGLDHRWKALGQNFGSGFNFNFVPATAVQQTETLRRNETARRQFDAFCPWPAAPCATASTGACPLPTCCRRTPSHAPKA